jgi:hypothetical protein
LDFPRDARQDLGRFAPRGWMSERLGISQKGVKDDLLCLVAGWELEGCILLLETNRLPQ